uniref:Uncharacterized protein n=1 Tax=Ixodes ricinus TaxID=34613 RepID=A0A6B0U6G9_IXORI
MSANVGGRSGKGKGGRFLVLFCFLGRGGEETGMKHRDGSSSGSDARSDEAWQKTAENKCGKGENAKRKITEKVFFFFLSR